MSKFKIGDTVKCIDARGGAQFKEGDSDIITDIDEHNFVQLDKSFRAIWYHADRFELIETKKEEPPRIPFKELHPKCPTCLYKVSCADYRGLRMYKKGRKPYTWYCPHHSDFDKE